MLLRTMPTTVWSSEPAVADPEVVGGMTGTVPSPGRMGTCEVEGVWADDEEDPPQMGDSNPPSCLRCIAGAARTTEAKGRKLENFIVKVIRAVERVDARLFALVDTGWLAGEQPLTGRGS
jgi:hypothetical protein